MAAKYLVELENILAKNPKRVFKAKELARMLGVKKNEYIEFRRNLKKYAVKGLIAKYKKSQYGTIKRAATLEGELHVKTQGYGFLITPDDREDIFISQKNMGTALHKDLVRVQLYAHSRGRSTEGRVIEVLTRSRKSIVGTYQKNKNYGFVIPDDLKINKDIFIPENENLSAKSGQKVVVEFTDWQEERNNPEGKIVEVLGFPQDPGVDVASVAKSFDLPMNFPEAVVAEAEAVPVEIPEDELAARLDLRQITCFTIDPEDAKDFDDAVSIRRLGNGDYELGVHIADVSYFVNEHGLLDREAMQRGTSVYLVDRVVPMLPEKLSNEVCSLRPAEDRLTFSCIMQVTPDGWVRDYSIKKTVIHSKRRFSYMEVQKIIAHKDGEAPFADEIHMMYELSQVLIRRRAKLGSLDFDLPEAKVILDEQGVPIEIIKRVREDSHRLIEEFMLLANQTVTEHIDKKLAQNKQKPPFIYRIHEEPDPEKMADFKKFVKALGHPIDPNRRVTPKLLREYLKGLAGSPEENIIEDLMLRSLMKAKYSIKNAGHFGLAFRSYTHFTSPIRRYPDLMVHRLLKDYLVDFDLNEVNTRRKNLEHIAKVSSEREIVAQEAERESVKMKKVEYMQRHLGEEFSGIISGVVSFGIFVELDDLMVEGLVHMSDLADDYYIHDEKSYKLTGTNTGNTYRLGDAVRVRVVRVDTDERIVDFILA
jgi:ribonuclease R